jgi:hypothetical protein
MKERLRENLREIRRKEDPAEGHGVVVFPPAVRLQGSRRSQHGWGQWGLLGGTGAEPPRWAGGGAQPHQGAKIQVDEVVEPLEPDLLYPLLRGRDVQRWQAEPSACIIVPQNPEAPAVPIQRRNYNGITLALTAS